MPSESTVVAVLQSMPEYVDAFKRAFPGEPKPITYDNMASDRGLRTQADDAVTLGRAAQGDQAALTPRSGRFQDVHEAGCQTCHNGALLEGRPISGSAWRRRTRGPRTRTDEGDQGATDQSVFKVPSLRNVEKTGPFFHDGKTDSLEQAVREMGEYQLGRTLTDQQIQEIVDFLKVLTGKIDPEYIKPPVLRRARQDTEARDERLRPPERGSRPARSRDDPRGRCTSIGVEEASRTPGHGAAKNRRVDLVER